MSSVALNPNLDTLPVYVPGKPIEEVAREVGLEAASIVKLASNENPLGPSPKALAAMERVLRNLHLYPDGNAFYLKRKLAETLGVEPANLILGNGSNEIIEFVGHAFMNPEADPRTLIRRVSFDLVGLPPTPEEIDAFEEACRAAGGVDGPYRELVDRLLASPHHGERWARHWLDVVRFAESHGFEMNRVRDNAWPYRDWVIGAFNADMPYDEFVRRQLCGDQLGDDAATGFIVGGPRDMVAYQGG